MPLLRYSECNFSITVGQGRFDQATGGDRPPGGGGRPPRPPKPPKPKIRDQREEEIARKINPVLNAPGVPLEDGSKKPATKADIAPVQRKEDDDDEALLLL